ncbi:AfsR/SARP family transcriptional regulator [Nonomuraea basaltis]|uniref:AfsR/SARP family transcriptional regulator n=1 Tax=Nonomuraea basaltis TaxID=2495887 RepID=UPI00110C4422|nr:AfsR/SARP family transcriptional regulator [Nonomuraea basaltis]TMR95006.1 SARP family transcriptional regulator [Nonomuraea basaltis]
MTVRFGVLGPLRIDGGQAPGPAKHRTLLAALLLSAPERVPVERLMSVVWDDRPPASAESVLRVYVSALRKLVGGIRTVPGGYLIEVDPDDVDCHRFERLVAGARQARAAGQVADAADGFRAALGLWRGQALADVESSVLRRAHAVPLEELRLTALEERVELDLRLGRGTEVVGELRALVGAHPLRERAWVRLIEALHQAGRRSEALGAYQDARRTLVEELGLEPGAELNAAQQRVLNDADRPPLEGASPWPPAGADPLRVDGDHRRIVAGGDELPPDISDFAGRRQVLDWIHRTAREQASAAPVHLILHGPPGCGKSAVAVHAATGLELPDGRLYASLGARPPSAVLEDLLRSLGCPDGAVPPALDDRVRLYRSMTARRRLLVVLDDAADEAQVRPLLPTGPGSLTVVTSRSSLPGLEAARAYELGVLDEDEAVAMLAGVAGHDRVRAEPEPARRIVRLCGHLPLALRIAGSRLARKPGWTLDHLAGRLGDERRRLDELSAGDLAVRGSLALGYRGLPDPERRLLRELGALSAPDFASWVLDADLEPLAEAGLLQSRGLDEAGQERYGWHDLTRLYAIERLAGEDGGPAAVLAARAEAILERARQARAALLPAEPGTGRTQVHLPENDPALETGWLRQEARWLSAERRFLVAAVGDLYRADLHEAAWRLAFYLTPLFELGAHHDDWHATTAIGLDAARVAGHRRGEALLLRGLADLHRAEGRMEAAEAALRAAQPLVEGLELARITLRLGLVQARSRPTEVMPGDGPAAGEGERWSPRVAQAEQAFVRALGVFEEAGDRRGRADALRALGALRQDEERLRESLAAYQDLSDPRGEAEALLDLARLHLGARRHPQARDCVERRLRINRRLGDRLPEAAALLVLAEVAGAEGAPDAAASAAREALETFTQYGDRRNAGHALLSLARAALDLDDPDGAVDVLIRAMGEFDALGDDQGRAAAERLVREARGRRGQRI